MFKIHCNLTGSKPEEFQPLFEVIETIYPAPPRADGLVAYHNPLVGFPDCNRYDRQTISCSAEPPSEWPGLQGWGREYRFFLIGRSGDEFFPRVSLDSMYLVNDQQQHFKNGSPTGLEIETGMPCFAGRDSYDWAVTQGGLTFREMGEVDMLGCSLRMVAELLRRFDSAKLLQDDCPRTVVFNPWDKDVLMAGYPEPAVTTAHLAAVLDYIAADRNSLECATVFANVKRSPFEESLLVERCDEVRALLRAETLPDPPVSLIGWLKAV